MPRRLSKSKIIAYRQCPRRLWLEIHRPELRDDSASEAVFAVGNQVGEIAQQIYASDHSEIIDAQQDGYEHAFARSAEILEQKGGTVFEAGIQFENTFAFADVMVSSLTPSGLKWCIIEVKSSTKMKDYHLEDLAVQCYLARESGLNIDSSSIAHVNNSFVYQGDGDYSRLLMEN